MKSKQPLNMARYLDPKSDLIFKRIFGEHPDLLISFLNALMPFEPGRFIQQIEYLPAEQVPENPVKKNSIVDVKCMDNYKRQFIVEMQMFWSLVFQNRIVFNAGKAYVRQLNRNETYDFLYPVYSLAILNDNFDHKTDQFYHHFQIVNRENTDEIIPGLEFVLVELPKFQPQTWADRKMAVLWLRFLNEVNETVRAVPAEMMENELISKAVELCEEAAFSDGELEVYDAIWDAVRVERSIRYGSLREGEAIGMKKGEAIGMKKMKDKVENIVLNSHKAGLSIETIATITGLATEQIAEILCTSL
jgi:predicted transposase/invertase (TIGR01784 family)